MGASDSKNKEGRKLIKAYQKKHRSLSQSKDDRHMKRLFNLYGGKKGHLDEREAKLFIRDVLFVCEMTKEVPDLQSTIDAIFHELDPTNSNKLQYQELLKPSWGKVQDLLHTVYAKMNLNVLTNTDSSGSLKNSPKMPRDPNAGTPSTSSSPGCFPPLVRKKLDDSTDLSESDFEDCCPPSFICPISTEIMTDPVILVETKTTYDRKSIEQWLLQHTTDPSTGLEIKSKEILPVLALKNAIEEWKNDMIELQKKNVKNVKKKN